MNLQTKELNMYGIRFERDSRSALTDMVFFSKEKAQEYIDSENETRVRLGLPGVYVFQKLIAMDTPSDGT